MDGIDLVAVVTGKDGHADALERILKACVAPSRAELGCLRYDLNRDAAAPNRFVFIERWSDDAAMEAHEGTHHFEALVDGMREHITQPPLIMRLEPR